MNSFVSKFGVTLAALALVIAPATVSAAGITTTISSPANGASFGVNQNINFTSSATGGNPASYNYVWSWGDGTQTVGQNVTHKYTSVGSKKVDLLVTDVTGNSGAAQSINITITDGTIDNKPVISNIQVTGKTQTEATITWTTDIPATSRVIYDTVSHNDITGASAPNYGYANSTTRDDAKVTSHSVRLTGLTPGTQYYFRVLSSK